MRRGTRDGIRRRACVVLAAVGLAAIAAGCGGGGDRLSKEEYEREMQALSQRLGESVGPLDAASSVDAAAEAMGEVREAMEEAVGELDEMNPPEDVEEDHQQLQAGVEQFANDLEELEQAIEDGDLEDVEQLAQELQSGSGLQQVDRATEAIKAKGYDIESE